MKNFYKISVLAAAISLAACGGDDNAENFPGSLSIAGSATEGSTLTATLTDQNGVSGGNEQYSWFANGVPIAGASASTFVITAAQDGADITASVLYEDDDGFVEVASSTNSITAIANSPGEITISGSPSVGETLVANLSDANGFPDSIAFTWTADDVVIDGETGASLVLTDAQVGTAIAVSASYTDNNGFTESVSSAPTNPVSLMNNAAEFSGLTATISNDTETLTGTVTVTDADEGEASIVAETDTATTFGTFSIDEQGAWTYTLDTDNATVAALPSASDTVTDTISIASADGTTADLVITITGTDANLNVAVIRDTNDSDTGELRYVLPEDLLSGSVSLSFNRVFEATDTISGNRRDGFITLFNESNSTSGQRAILDLRIRNDEYQIRDQTFDITEVPKPGEFQDAVITWDAPDATTPPMVTITIDGVSFTTEAFAAPENAIGGVSAIAFRFADNSSVLPEEATFAVDDVKVTSDVAATTEVFSDDFESYAIGDSLDSDNDASPYNSSTSEASVAARGDFISRGEGSGNQIATITDTDSGDTGELRYQFSDDLRAATGGVLAGKVSVSFKKDDDAVEINDAFEPKDAYITLYNTLNSVGSGRAIADLRIQSEQFVLRDQDDIAVPVPFRPGEWHDVEISWEAPDGDTPPMVTVTIDGVAVTSEPFMSPENALGGVRAIAFRFADNTAILPADITFNIDDVKIYTDAAGTVLEFEDDFEAYAEGDSLDTDNGASPYNSSTFQAIVTKE